MSQYNRAKTLLYDGLCPMCGNAVNALRQLGLLKQVAAVPWEKSGLQDEGLESRIRSELLLRDSETGQVLGGFSAVTELMRLTPAYRLLGTVLKFPPLAWLGERLYKIISLNRRILSPPNTGGMACACDPPFHLGYRIGFILILLFLNLVGCYSFVAGAQPVWLAFMGVWVFWNIPFVMLWLVCLFALRKRLGVVVEQTGVLMGLMGLAFIVFNSLVALLVHLNWVAAKVLDPFLMIYCLLMYWGLFRSFRKRSQALALPVWVPICWIAFTLGFPIFLFSLS